MFLHVSESFIFLFLLIPWYFQNIILFPDQNFEILEVESKNKNFELQEITFEWTLD